MQLNLLINDLNLLFPEIDVNGFANCWIKPVTGTVPHNEYADFVDLP